MKARNLRLDTLIEIADVGYPDHAITDAFHFPDATEDLDGLACFIVRELTSTLDPKASAKQPLDEAIRVIGVAREELANVLLQFELSRERLLKTGNTLPPEAAARDRQEDN